MAQRPLRSQLNQIRAWVRQGRTDAWIAHQLDVSASELREFRRRHELTEAGSADAEATAEPEAAPEGARPRRRRRRRRRAGDGRAGAAMQATFDHGADDGFGLWLDPAVEDDPVYAEHWAGHRPVEVTIEPDRIVIRRA